VAPQFIRAGHSLEGIKNEFNAVSLIGEFCDEQRFIGKGAGSLPTGAAVLSDISALSYDYRYEYKKHYNQGKIHFSNDSLLEVYVSFKNPSSIDLSAFENIKEKYFSFDQSYVIGEVCIHRLLNGEWLNNPLINVILSENSITESLGKLCVQDLKTEVFELQKGHDLLQKISQ
jgi:homoserine dehydrogenase